MMLFLRRFRSSLTLYASSKITIFFYNHRERAGKGGIVSIGGGTSPLADLPLMLIENRTERPNGVEVGGKARVTQAFLKPRALSRQRLLGIGI
jgi:hypothetical protein